MQEATAGSVPFTFALKTSRSSYKANASRFPGAMTRTPHAVERMSSLEVKHPSLQRDTPTFRGWLAGGHLHPVKMLVCVQMTPLLGSPGLRSAWKPLLCVGKVFPPSAERNRRQ